MQLRITDIRTYAFRLISLSTSEITPEIFYNINIIQLFNSSIFNHLSHLNYYQLKLLFRNLIFPIFKIIPNNYFILFRDIFKSLFIIINQRLTSDWTLLINNRNNDNKINNNNNINLNNNNNLNLNNNYEEIIFENIVIEFSREFVENLNILIANCSEEDRKNDILVSDIGKFWCSDKIIFDEFISFLMNSSSFADSNIKNISSLILSHILPFICSIFF